jgi:hypothetical protein
VEPVRGAAGDAAAHLPDAGRADGDRRQGEFDEFDLNEFFEAKGTASDAEFKHKSDVQKWLDIIRGGYAPTQVDAQEWAPGRRSRTRTCGCCPTSSTRSGSCQRGACHAMANLLAEKQNVFWHDYKVSSSPGPAGIGLDALPPVRKAIGSGLRHQDDHPVVRQAHHGRHRPQWSSILMLRNLNSPETYFQAAFRVQSPWSIKNPNGDNPNEEEILKPVCFVFDFAPTRALRQLADYGIGLSPESRTPRTPSRTREVPARAGLRRREHDPGRCRRHPRHRHGGHLRHAAGPQVGVRAPRQRRQRHPAQDHDNPEAMAPS